MKPEVLAVLKVFSVPPKCDNSPSLKNFGVLAFFCVSPSQ